MRGLKILLISLHYPRSSAAVNVNAFSSLPHQHTQTGAQQCVDVAVRSSSQHPHPPPCSTKFFIVY